MKTKLTPVLTIKTSRQRWESPDEILQAIAESKALGYEEISPVRSKCFVFVKMLALASVKHRAYAILHEDAQSIWVDFFSVDARGGCFAATNAEAPLIGLVAQRPMFFISHQLPKVSLSVLHEEFLSHRTRKKWSKPTLKELPAAYELVCAADSQWQEQHLQGKDSEKVMQDIVATAYQRAKAVRRRNPSGELLLLLRDMEAPERPGLPKTLTAAAMEGDVEAMKLFLEGGSDINEKTGYASPLAAAALCGRSDAVNFLLERGANPAAGEFAMFSAIANAAGRGYFEITERLLAAGVPKAHKDAALQEAKRQKHEALAALLQGRPVPVELRAQAPAKSTQPSFGEVMDNVTVLMGREPESRFNAKERGQAEKRALQLLKNPAIRSVLSTVHKEHGSYLELALKTGRTRLIRAVVEAGVASQVLSSALITAAGCSSREQLELLLQAGADPKFENNGWTALLAASRRGDPEIVRRLLAAGANPRTRTEGGETPMTAVCGPFGKQIREALKEAAQPGLPPQGSAIGTRGKVRKDFASGRGVAQFKDAMGHPEWSLACIEASPEAVARALSKLRPKARWHRDTAKARLNAKPPFAFVFRLRGQAWTILLRTVGWLEMEDLEQLPEDARGLSAALKTRTITYMSEDTSGCEGYELFQNGKSIETADCMGEVQFKSSWRKKPKFGDNFPERTFIDLGIYLPECWMDHDGYETKLVLGGIRSDAVERLDCFELAPG